MSDTKSGFYIAFVDHSGDGSIIRVNNDESWDDIQKLLVAKKEIKSPGVLLFFDQASQRL